jgi:hypothetical protein
MWLALLQGPLGKEDEADLRAFALFAALTVGAVFFLVSTALRAKVQRQARERRDTNVDDEKPDRESP